MYRAFGVSGFIPDYMLEGIFEVLYNQLHIALITGGDLAIILCCNSGHSYNLTQVWLDTVYYCSQIQAVQYIPSS